MTSNYFARRFASFVLVPRTIVLLGLVAILAAGIFPPWTQTLALPGRVVQYGNAYGWLTSPPYPAAGWPREVWDVKIDATRLGVEWILVCVAVGALLWIFRRRDVA
jgi:hypothetical protein